MIRERFNEEWVVSSPSGNPLMDMFTGGGNTAKTVTLPYDAMIYEERTPDTKNGSQTGFYPGGLYHYVKKFTAPAEWEGRTVTLEFEGAYMNARVYINGDYAGGYPHGYSNFYVSADHFLKYGEENEIKVIVNNSAELNSRWYSGSGLYRNVNIIVGKPLHIPVDGLRISAPEAEADAAVVAVTIPVRNSENVNRKVKLLTRVLDADGTLVREAVTHATVFGNTEITAHQRIPVEKPQRWDCEHPYLYRCEVKLIAGEEVWDEEIQTFGIRKLQLDADRGLRINGKGVKLRGACIHHDNGIIGATTLERAEERRCEQLKAAGFNCIRSSHHPVSKAMLEACDRQGMLVMDELSDMWTRSKNSNDYAQNFIDYWERDVEVLVAKDYNHPSVILYSMGNEIQEAGTAKGAELNRKIDNKIKSLDATRYTTNAINGMLAVMDSIQAIITDITKMTPEQMMAQMASSAETKEQAEEQNDGGSDVLNSMMGMMQGPLADALAAHPVMSGKIEEYAESMDVAGYNYMTGRHALDRELYPNRVVLGAETFPADIVRLWDIVKNNSHVIGDMTWTGYDYLGEAGIGIFFYDGTVNFSAHWPDRVAYIGDIDLIGYRRPISYLREIVFGLRKDPYIAVERLNRYGEKPNKTPWMWKDNIASWTWPGYEGKPAKIDIYADADEVELFLNSRSLGRKPAGEAAGFIAPYELSYEPGELKAVSFIAGKESGSCVIRTADDRVKLAVECDRKTLKADGADLAYFTVGLVDQAGNGNLFAGKTVTVEVEGVGTLQGFGSAQPQGGGSYQDTTWETYDGYVLAVVRAGKENGEIRVTFTAEGCDAISRTIQVTGGKNG